MIHTPQYFRLSPHADFSLHQKKKKKSQVYNHEQVSPEATKLQHIKAALSSSNNSSHLTSPLSHIRSLDGLVSVTDRNVLLFRAFLSARPDSHDYWIKISPPMFLKGKWTDPSE